MFIEENVAQKFAVLLERPTLLLFVHVCVHLFHGYISSIHIHCVGLDHDAYVTAAAIAVRLKPRPTIRVLVGVETRHVTEPGRTAPSLLS